MTTFDEAKREIDRVRESGESILRLFDLDADTLPERIGSLTSLRHLVLHRGGLKQLPDSLGDLANLEKIHVIRHSITRFPNVVLRLRSLKSLWLEGNEITAIPESISQLSQLQFLDMTCNLMEILPANIVELTSLRRLGLSINPLRKLPENIDKMSSLEEIHLHRAEVLRTFPNSIGRLPNLKSMVLSHCPATPEHLRHYFAETSFHRLRGTEALKHWLLGTPDPCEAQFDTLAKLRLPNELLSASGSDASVSFDFDGASAFGSPPFTLMNTSDLNAEWLDVIGLDGVGMWSVPVVRLLHESNGKQSLAMLWLPNFRRFASYDAEDGSLYVFRQEATWNVIANDFAAYFFATHCCGPADEQYVTRVERLDSFPT